MIDKQKLKKSLEVLILIFIIIILLLSIQGAISRYQREIGLTSDAEAAFWLVRDSIQETTKILDQIAPNEPVSFNFYIRNYELEKRTEVSLSYKIKITATTNLPLEYSLFKSSKECVKKENIIQDEDGTYYKEMIFEPAEDDDFELGFLEEDLDRFELYINFPEPEEDSLQYADLAENIRIQVKAEQIIN